MAGLLVLLMVGLGGWSWVGAHSDEARVSELSRPRMTAAEVQVVKGVGHE